MRRGRGKVERRGTKTHRRISFGLTMRLTWANALVLR